MNGFSRYIGIDYSGAKTPTESLPGLRIYSASEFAHPAEIFPPPSPRKYWTRRGIAEWLVQTLKENSPTIVGIDHGFSFPLKYFERYNLAHNWDLFLDDFWYHWPTDQDHTYVEFIRNGLYGDGKERQGERRWRRLTEIRAGAAKSVFFFDVQGSVAKSTHAGIPWLRYIRKALGNAVHFWPFDGWTPPKGVHVVVEVYPSLWSHLYVTKDQTKDQKDAYAVSSWLREMDRAGNLMNFFKPSFETDNDEATAKIEGWILGVG